MKKGQISVEYLLLIGLLLLIIVPLIYYGIREANANAAMASAEDVVKSLSVAADEVYALGSGSKKFVDVYMPKGVTDSYIGHATNEEAKKEVGLVLHIYGEDADVFSKANVEVKGSIEDFTTTSGPKKIQVYALPGFVLIGRDNQPPVYVTTYPQADVTGNTIDIVVKVEDASDTICEYVDITSGGSPDFNYGEETVMTVEGSLHSVEQTGLETGIQYKYSIKCADTADPPNLPGTGAGSYAEVTFYRTS